MNHRFTLFTILIALSTCYKNVAAQCNVDIFASSESITCGDSVMLTAFGHTGNFVMNNDFNDGTVGTGWSATASAMFDNPCGQHPGGDTYLWFGDSTPHPRSLTTVALDLQLGGIICFDLKFATQSDPAPCEGPDEPDEGVILEYSIDGGNTWEPIHYFHPQGGYDPVLTEWNNYCFNIPTNAMTPATLIRWEQISTSGAIYDHWGLNNIEIILIDPEYDYVWQHDGFIGQETNVLFPQVDTSFTVYLTNHINDTCTATIDIEVSPPTFISSIEPTDTAICPSDCVEIQANANILFSPASQPTFTNNFTQLISGLFGNPVTETVPMSVDGLNMNAIEPGSIESVCFYIQNANHLTVSLVCPNGMELLLTESATAGSFGDSTGNVTCFTLDATQTIAQDTPHYTGEYLPDNNGSLDDLVGCSANGLWDLKVISTHPLIGIHTLNTWSITFNDPEIIVPAQFHWEPTTNMSNSGELNPTVCPAQQTTYTLFVYDAHGCDTTTQTFTANIDPACCDIEIDEIIFTEPTCNDNNGSITVTTFGGDGIIEYSIDNGVTFQSSNVFTNLEPGTYEVIAQDEEDCVTFTETIVLATPDIPEIQLQNTADPLCGIENGEISLTVSGGVGIVELSIDSGTTYQSGTDFFDLSGGVYTAIAIDEDNCHSNAIEIELNDAGNPELIVSNIEQPSCGESDGEISVSATGGTEPYVFEWSNNETGQTISNLAGGQFNVIVTDDNGCTDTLSVTLDDLNTAEIDDTALQIENTPCGFEEGSITGLVVTGNAPFEYEWFDNVQNLISSSTTTTDIFDLAPGVYTLTVTDVDDCVSVFGPVEIIETGLPEADESALVIEEATCGLNDGSISGITVSGNAPFDFVWHDESGNIVNSSQADANLTGQDAGEFSLLITDAGGCELLLGPYNIPAGSLPEIIDYTVTDPQSCAVPDGSIQVSVTGGTGNYTYLWSHDNNLNTPEASGLSSGIYSLTIEDIGGPDCVAEQTFELSTPEDVVIEVITTDVSCFGETDGTAMVNVIEGATPFQYSWSTGDSVSSIEFLSPGNYSVEVTDANQCETSMSFEIGEPDSLFISSVNITDPSCYGFSNGVIDIEVFGGVAPYQFDWIGYLGQTGQTISGIPAGIYPVTISDANGCILSDSISLLEPPETEASITASETQVMQWETVELTAEAVTGLVDPIQYAWQPSGLVDYVNCQTTTTGILLQDTTFTVVLTDADGCDASASIFIEVEEIVTNVYIPNAFSPNSDGVNDEFRVYGTGIKDLTLRVFDRWGTMVFESEGVGSTWDGTYKGRDLPQGIYVYSVRVIFVDREMVSKEGSVTIIR